MKALWKRLKSLPGWAWGVILSLVALAYFLIKKIFLQQAVIGIERERAVIETDHFTTIISNANEEAELIDQLEEAHNNKMAMLDKRKEDIEIELSKGPAGVADAWNKRLKGTSE